MHSKLWNRKDECLQLKHKDADCKSSHCELEVNLNFHNLHGEDKPPVKDLTLVKGRELKDELSGYFCKPSKFRSEKGTGSGDDAE